MQRWVSQQLRLVNRQAGIREKDSLDAAAARKAAYLAKLGLANKGKELQEGVASKKAPWHLAHMAEGDVFRGTFEHPDIARGDKVDVAITVSSPTQGFLTSRKAGFEGSVRIEQDFPIPFEKGEDRDNAIVAYIFHKFNMGWRDFQQPVPKASELERLSLQGLRLFFRQISGGQTEGFPEEAEYRQNAAEPDAGMTKAEFLRYIKAEDEGYLESALPSIFTGRRVRISTEELVLDGDFQAEASGYIFGYTFLNGRGGGSFVLELGRAA